MIPIFSFGALCACARSCGERHRDGRDFAHKETPGAESLSDPARRVLGRSLGQESVAILARTSIMVVLMLVVVVADRPTVGRPLPLFLVSFGPFRMALLGPFAPVL